MKLQIKAASSSGDDFYIVDFVQTNGKLAVFCNCTAGELGKFCKHKWDLLEGHRDRLADPNEEPLLVQALEWVGQSDFKNLYGRVNELEAEAEELKEKIKGEKRVVERRLREGF
jgi:hypothetical protein